MPRGERPLDNEDDPLVRFAADLRRLRAKAGSPPYRELSRRAHYSAAALSDAAAGRKLPSLAVTLAYVAACDGETAGWQQRWEELAAELADPSNAQERVEHDDKPAPYLGLQMFQPEDAARFYGREELVAHLLTRVAQQRFVVIIGPSGSGKSSLLRAGLIHHVRSHGIQGYQGDPALITTPGPHPLDEFSARLAALVGTTSTAVHAALRTDSRTLHLTALQALTDRSPKAELLVVVDQFEEVFTLCRDATERAQYIRLLRTAADAANSRTRIVLGVRADFYGHCIHHPELIEALGNAQVPVGPLNTDELRSAITQPAHNAGLRLENGLVSRLVADATGQPGVLPLLSHALLETWRRRRGTTLTLVGYIATGGIERSVARTAETVYSALSERQQQWARQLFIRLVALGEGTEDTKQRVPRGELELDDPDRVAVVEHLTQARLLILDRDSVEIAHEALVRCWPRLHEWLTSDREGLRIHRRLSEATTSWESLGRDPEALYRGIRLAQANRWATTNESALTTREREFLHAGLSAADAELLAVRRRARRLRQLLVSLAALLVVAVATTGFAVRVQRDAIDQRDRAVAQRVLGEAATLNTTNSALALQLALAAYRLAPLPNVRSALLDLVTAPFAVGLAIPDRVVQSIAFSPNGELLAVAATAGGAVRLAAEPRYDVWLYEVADLSHPRIVASLHGLPGPVSRVSFSPDGQTLATAGANATNGSVVLLWDVVAAGSPRLTGSFIPGGRLISSLAFGPDGRTIAVATVTPAAPTGAFSSMYGNDMGLWDVTDLAHPRKQATFTGSSPVPAIAVFSPSGHTLATSGVAEGNAASVPVGNEVRLWDVTDPQGPRPLATVSGLAGTPVSLVFSPDAHLLATSELTGFGATNGLPNGDETRLWNVTDPQHPEPAATFTTSSTSAHDGVVFGRDGHTLAVIGGDRIIQLWDITDPDRPRQFATLAGSTGVEVALAFGADGRTLADVDLNGDVRLTDISNYVVPVRARTTIGAVDFAPNARMLAAGHDGLVGLWDVADPYRRQLLASFSVGSAQAFVTRVVFAADGHLLAVESAQNTGAKVGLWDTTDPRNPQALTVPAMSADVTTTLEIGADGHILATVAAAERIVRLWSITDPGDPHELAHFMASDSLLEAMVFTPDGRSLFTADANGTIRTWNIADPSHPQPLGVTMETVAPVKRLALGPDGRMLAAGTADGQVVLWDVTDPGHSRRSATLTTSSSAVSSVAYANDGRTIAAGGTDGMVALWDVTDPRRPSQSAAFTTSTNTVNSLAFSSNDHTLAVAGKEYPQLLETSADQAARHICGLTLPTLTTAQWNQYFPGITYRPPCA